jgi:hypothetical protein
MADRAEKMTAMHENAREMYLSNGDPPVKAGRREAGYGFICFGF